MKDSQEKGEKVRLLSTVERHEAELNYVGKGKKEGTIKVYGATLLTSSDFYSLGKILPGTNDSWWLYDRGHVLIKTVRWSYEMRTLGKIRPVLIIKKICGELNVGEIFHINYDKFKLLTPSIAIKTACLEDMCTFNAKNYESSILSLCVYGWYMKLIRENNLLKQEMSSAT